MPTLIVKYKLEAYQAPAAPKNEPRFNFRGTLTLGDRGRLGFDLKPKRPITTLLSEFEEQGGSWIFPSGESARTRFYGQIPGTYTSPNGEITESELVTGMWDFGGLCKTLVVEVLDKSRLWPLGLDCNNISMGCMVLAVERGGFRAEDCRPSDLEAQGRYFETHPGSIPRQTQYDPRVKLVVIEDDLDDARIRYGRLVKPYNVEVMLLAKGSKLDSVECPPFGTVKVISDPYNLADAQIPQDGNIYFVDGLKDWWGVFAREISRHSNDVVVASGDHHIRKLARERRLASCDPEKIEEFLRQHFA